MIRVFWAFQKKDPFEGQESWKVGMPPCSTLRPHGNSNSVTNLPDILAEKITSCEERGALNATRWEHFESERPPCPTAAMPRADMTSGRSGEQEVINYQNPA
mmetsp:Transcript_31894/g.68303  ORF Transcript_31894/g.68303 Transcript_31894/m.68303 type:complete len:102 (-) Transcript_31894:148-453(-)